MLRSRIQAALARRAELGKRDKGFTLIELLVVVIIIGILSAIAIPVFLGQRQKAFDASVQSDMKNLAIAAETAFTDNMSYPALADGTAPWGTNGTAPVVSKGNTFEVYTTPTGTSAGYVIVGKNAGSDKIWISSSFNGGAPKNVAGGSVTDLATAGDLLVANAPAFKNPVDYASATPLTIS